jgi:hypothetical protein
MRRDLIEDARRRSILVTDLPDSGNLTAQRRPEELAARIDAVFAEMAAEHPEWGPIVEMKYYLGLPDDEAAHALGSGLAVFRRQWQDARWWLFRKTEAHPW